MLMFAVQNHCISCLYSCNDILMALNFEGCKIFSEIYIGRSQFVLLLLLFYSLYVFQMMENKYD